MNGRQSYPAHKTATHPPLPITACSVFSACGPGTQSLYEALLDGNHRLQPPHLFDIDFPTWCGEIADSELPEPDPSLRTFSTRNARIALATVDHPDDGLRNAVEQAIDRYGATRVGIVLGSSTSGIYETENAYAWLEEHDRAPASFSMPDQHIWVATARFLKFELGLEGPCYAISTACSSSSKSIASARRLIATGVCDAVLTGGVDSLCRLTMHGFKSLDIMSERPCAPLDKDRGGISLGEGAGLLLLERPDGAFSHCIHLLSCGESSDAHHMTAPHPEGEGAVIAMREALVQAGIAAGDVDYVNLHATGTVLNDRAEMMAMEQVFGPETHCSGTKGLTGHTLGAAGGIETIVTWLALRHGFRPGTCNLNRVDSAFRCSVNRDSETDVPITFTMNNNFGFGGNNTSVVLGWRHD
ncbi:MAG: beta-ketoacyl-ACP synthase [Pseudomonadota bacterium]|nr:beta-ketoacyl-ACP synthase [Pseudomonadota bacterium]